MFLGFSCIVCIHGPNCCVTSSQFHPAASSREAYCLPPPARSATRDRPAPNYIFAVVSLFMCGSQISKPLWWMANLRLPDTSHDMASTSDKHRDEFLRSLDKYGHLKPLTLYLFLTSSRDQALQGRQIFRLDNHLRG